MASLSQYSSALTGRVAAANGFPALPLLAAPQRGLLCRLPLMAAIPIGRTGQSQRRAVVRRWHLAREIKAAEFKPGRT
uniref:Uncharacterized protein n=1 Tax=Thermogemmatispora argillosa TaxID=2045280 RepID=A0A455T709_9CHLR|nr:hypothetical protein KTA_21630 [Thermogemmatispora argillosa]